MRPLASSNVGIRAGFAASIRLIHFFLIEMLTILATGWLDAAVARADTADFWTGGSGIWSDGTHWSLTYSPDNFGPHPGSYSADILSPGSDVSCSTTAVIDNLALSGGNSLTVSGSGIAIAVLASPGAGSGLGSIANSGLLSLTGSSELELYGVGLAPMQTVTFTGGGIVALSSGASITGHLKTEVLDNEDNTIEGSGSIGGISIVNKGLIEAVLPGPGMALTISPNASGLTNTGTLSAIGGATLKLLPSTGTYLNTGGTISAEGPGATVYLGGTAGTGTTIIHGGILTTDPDPTSSFVNLSVTELKDLTLAGNYKQGLFAITNLRGTITNDGAMTVASFGPGFSNVNLDMGDVTLTGSGMITFISPVNPFPFEFTYTKLWGFGGPRLTIDALQTIKGAVTIGSHSTASSPQLTNKGTINANMSTTPGTPGMPATLGAPGITIYTNPAAGGFINSGTIEATNGSTLTIFGNTVTNFAGASKGTIVADGTTDTSPFPTVTAVVIQSSTATGVNVNATINGGNVSTKGIAGGMGGMHMALLRLNGAVIHGGSTVDNDSSVGPMHPASVGQIETVSGSSNTIGGTLINPTGGMVTINDDSSLALETGGTYTNNGTIRLQSAGMPTGLNVSGPGGTVTLLGSGTVNLLGPTSHIDGTGTERLVNISNSIVGGGAIGAGFPGGGTMSLTNKPGGLILANNGSVPLLVESNDDGILNTGNMWANGGDLHFFSAEVTNFEGAANGLVRTFAGSKVAVTFSTINGGNVDIMGPGEIDLSGGTIHGGTLTNDPAGVIRIQGGNTSILGGIVHNPAGGQIIVEDGSTLQLETDKLYDNKGTIKLDSAGQQTFLQPNGYGGNGDVTLDGGGEVLLAANANADNQIIGAGNERLVNKNNVIHGAGVIGMAVKNQLAGLIKADAPGAPLTIQPGGATFVNAGTMQAAGGTLVFNGGTITNFDGLVNGVIQTAAMAGDAIEVKGNATINGGVVGVLAGGTLTLNTGTIHQGTLTNNGAGTINTIGGTANTIGGTFNNIATGVVNIVDNSSLHLETGGTYDNEATINLTSTGLATRLVADGANGTVTLSGGGTIVLSNDINNRIIGADGTETLVNQDNTISGAGEIGRGSLSLTNRGTIDVSGAAGMNIQPNANGVINSGTIKATAGNLTLNTGTFTNFEGATDGLISVDRGAAPALTLTVTGDAIIDGGTVSIVGANTISLNSGTIHGGTLNNDPAGTITTVGGSTNTIGGTLNNPAGGTVIVVDGSTLALETGGVYNNAGTLAVASVAAATNLQLDGAGGTVTLSGGGTVTLTNQSYIFGKHANERLINLDNTISGDGNIGLSHMSLTNIGKISADNPSGVPLIIQANAGGVINSGILEATGGGILILDNKIFTNTTGIIQALGDFAEVQLTNGVVINGGSIGTTIGGLIRNLDEAALHTVTLDADFVQDEGSITDLIGTITNNGTMVMPASSLVTQIKLLSGDVTLAGGGTLVMKNSALNQIIAADGLARLTIGASQTVRGTGDIGVGMMTLTNLGTVIADQSTPLTIHPNSAGFINSGLLRAAAGSTLHVIGGYSQTAGDTNIDGTLNVTAGRLSASGGTLSGDGTINILAGMNLSGTVTKQGASTMNVSGPQSPAVGAVLNVNGGVVNFKSDAGSGGAANLTVNANAPVNFTGTQHLAALNIGPSTTVTLTRPSGGMQPSGGPQQVLVAGSLSLASTSDLDLKDNSMIVHGGADPMATFLAVEASIANAYDNASLDGHGIKSSTITDPTATGLGSALNSLLAAAFAPLDSMNGEPLTLDDTIVKYTYMGDATLDGVVNDDDASLIGGFYDNGAGAGHHWFEGDFTHDGLINDDDVSILSGNYNPGEPPLSGRMLGARYGAKFAAAFERGLAAQAVPEPSTLLLGALGLVALLGLACHRIGRRQVERRT